MHFMPLSAPEQKAEMGCAVPVSSLFSLCFQAALVMLPVDLQVVLNGPFWSIIYKTQQILVFLPSGVPLQVDPGAEGGGQQVRPALNPGLDRNSPPLPPFPCVSQIENMNQPTLETEKP